MGNSASCATILGQGFGFGPNEEVTVGWPTGPKQQLGTAITDSTGSFYGAAGLPFTIPLGTSTGLKPVVGKGGTTGVVGKGYVRVR